MPQATAALQNAMKTRYQSLDTLGPEEYLKDAGYKLRHDWLWEPKPGVKTHADMTPEEWEHMLFLIQEWDYGGLAV